MSVMYSMNQEQNACMQREHAQHEDWGDVDV